MEKFDLDKIWKGEDDSAHEYYEQIQPEINEKVRKRSRGIISRVKRTTMIELWLTLLIVPVVMFYLPVDSIKFWVIASILAVIVPGTIWFYLKFNRDLGSISQSSVKDALEKEIKVLSLFIRRLNIYTIAVAPIAYYIGIFIQIQEEGRFSEHEDIWTYLGIHFLISIPILAIFIWFFKEKYIYWLYGRPLKELKDIYEHLTNGVGQEE